jgi:hypothetical protein
LCPVATLEDRLRHAGAVAAQEQYERSSEDGRIRLSFEARTGLAVATHDLGRALGGVSGVHQVKVEPL